MKLIATMNSPFARMVRIVLDELNVDYELVGIDAFGEQSPQQISTINDSNPLMKVPALIDGDNTVFDSRVIVQYLLANHNPQNKFHADANFNVSRENALSTINGVMDSAVLRFIMGKTSDLDLNSGYMERSLTRMHSGLKYLENMDGLGDDFGVAEIALVCAFDWFAKRELIDTSGYPNLLSICDKYKTNAAITKTSIAA